MWFNWHSVISWLYSIDFVEHLFIDSSTTQENSIQIFGHVTFQMSGFSVPIFLKSKKKREFGRVV